MPPDRVEPPHRHCQELAAQLHQHRSPTLIAIVREVRVGTSEVTVTCDAQALAAALDTDRHADAPPTLPLITAARLTRSGRAQRLAQDNGTLAYASPVRSLVRLMVQARRWWQRLRAGDTNGTALAAAEGVSPAYVTRVLRLAFLAPWTTEAILAGRQRAGVTVASLTLKGTVEPEWRVQATGMLPLRKA